jgi:hypothetical protein
MKTLYNQDGTLSFEAQQLLSGMPEGVSLKEWRTKFKQFQDSISAEERQCFKALRKRTYQKKRISKMAPENLIVVYHHFHDYW